MPRSALNSIGSKDMVNAAAAILGIVGVFALVVACDSGEPPTGESHEHVTGWSNPLQSDTTWYLQSIEGSPIIEGTPQLLENLLSCLRYNERKGAFPGHIKPSFPIK